MKSRHDVSMVTGHRIAVPSKQRVWKDPRFVVGVLLIAISILGCSLMVSHARAGITVYQTTQPVAVGEVLGPNNTTLVAARPESNAYITEGNLQSGAIASRPLDARELVPTAATDPANANTIRRLMVTVDGLPTSVGVGDALELWFTPEQGDDVQLLQSGNQDHAPVIVAERVTLVSIDQAGAGLGQTGATRLEIAALSGSISKILRANEMTGTLSALPLGAK